MGIILQLWGMEHRRLNFQHHSVATGSDFWDEKVASGGSSTAMGAYTKAIGNYSTASGLKTTAEITKMTKYLIQLNSHFKILPL